MAIADPITKQVRIKKETAWGTAAGTTGGQQLRRVSSDLDLRKQTYESQEIRPDYQISDMRHGVRSVEGSIQGELSPLTYEMLMVAAMRKAWAATTALTGLSVTIAASGAYYTLARSAGDYLASGLKVGDVARLTAGTFNAANLNNNLLVVGLSTATATVAVLNGSSLVAEGPIASATLTVTGKRTWIPTTGHTDDSFTIEHWFSDIAQSEVFVGCKLQSLQVNLPPTGMAQITASFMGKDMTTGTAAYFSAPTAITSSGILAAVNGKLRYGSGAVVNVTGLNFTVDAGMSAQPVVGSNTYPDIFAGPVRVSGQITAFFEDATYRDAFVNETEGSLTVALTTNNTAAADFLGFTFPRIKLGAATKSDGGSGGIVLTIPFTALYNSAGGSGTSSEQTTLVIQDSLAP